MVTVNNKVFIGFIFCYFIIAIEKQRAVLTYRYFYGFTDSEISDLLCISRQAVHQLEMRAIAALKEYYCI